MFRQRVLIQAALLGALGGLAPAASAADLPALPIVKNVELQPLIAQVRRVIEATDYLGAPLAAVLRWAVDAGDGPAEPFRP